MLYPWPISLPPLHEVVSSLGFECPRPDSPTRVRRLLAEGCNDQAGEKPLGYDCELPMGLRPTHGDESRISQGRL